MPPRFAQLLCSVIALHLLLLVGCSTDTGPREDETTTDLRQISRVFESLQGFHNRPPKDLAEIKNFLADLHTDKQGDEPEKVLTSARDGEPYVIILGATFGGGSPDEIIVYEKTGANGTRYVMTSGRIVRQLSEDEFRQAKFAQGHRPGGA